MVPEELQEHTRYVKIIDVKYKKPSVNGGGKKRKLLYTFIVG